MRTKIQAMGAFVAIVLGGVETSTSAILCKAADGTLKVRSAVCQRKEARVDPVSLGLQGPPGPQGPGGPSGPQGPVGPLPKLKVVVRSNTFSPAMAKAPRLSKPIVYLVKSFRAVAFR